MDANDDILPGVAGDIHGDEEQIQTLGDTCDTFHDDSCHHGLSQTRSLRRHVQGRTSAAQPT